MKETVSVTHGRNSNHNVPDLMCVCRRDSIRAFVLRSDDDVRSILLFVYVLDGFGVLDVDGMDVEVAWCEWPKCLIQC